MNKLRVDLENCYGIKKLKWEFDFTEQRQFAIYAPNGSMKSSLAQTFNDVIDGVASRDRIFPKRICSRKITDEKDVELPKEGIFVILPFDVAFGISEKTSTLLVDAKLRVEYEKLLMDINETKQRFLSAIKEQSGSAKDLEQEISLAFTRNDDQFYRALIRVEKEVRDQDNAPFKDIVYDKVFDEKVLGFLAKKDSKEAIANYINKYNELLAASTYFKKGVFTYYNAATIAKSLADNGFFDAKHTVSLNAKAKQEISSQEELQNLIAKEKDTILNDKELKKQFAAIEKLIQKNADLRAFEAYLADHDEILARLENVDSLKEDVFKSYFKARVELYKELLQKYAAAEENTKRIQGEAARQRTQWEYVIDIFNSRFFVPFKLTVKNRESVILGQESMPTLAFTYEDGADKAPIEKSALLEVLSTGEKKALYVLNIIFEVEARRMAGQETVFVVDDIADSFDYKNKYAIIQYLMDIAEEPYFTQIILTHNFDFFRTICGRVVSYGACLMAVRNDDGIVLAKATGIKNVFVNDWKLNFFSDPKKRIASIPFIRNIVEYTKGADAPEYKKLTSLLHWKDDSPKITEAELCDIYGLVFGGKEAWGGATKTVIDTIREEARQCLDAADGINFENKIVLSIAIRLLAEIFMTSKIDDPKFVANIESNQTWTLLKKFGSLFKEQLAAIEILQRVVLMTPENIHVNSFMYEPILDMSDWHLRKLYQDVDGLK